MISKEYMKKVNEMNEGGEMTPCTLYVVTTQGYYDRGRVTPSESFCFEVLRVIHIRVSHPGYANVTYITPVGNRDKLLGVPCTDIYPTVGDALESVKSRLNAMNL